jgi:hypothetical protein
MSRREGVVRELMRIYRDLPKSDLNKEEIRKCLVSEMEIRFPNSHNENWLEAWIDNEFRNELEEKMEAFVSASFPNENVNIQFEDKTIKIDTSNMKLK